MIDFFNDYEKAIENENKNANENKTENTNNENETENTNNENETENTNNENEEIKETLNILINEFRDFKNSFKKEDSNNED